MRHEPWGKDVHLSRRTKASGMRIAPLGLGITNYHPRSRGEQQLLLPVNVAYNGEGASLSIGEFKMKSEGQMRNSDEIEQDVKAPVSGLSRRALLRAGAGASPVLLTFASGPVAANPFANNGACTLASSFVSVATFKSRNPTATTLRCSSQNADYWRDLAVSTPATAALNVTVATLLGNTSSAYNAMLVKDVLLAPLPTSGTVQTTGELGTLQHLIALALNLNAGFIIAGAGFDLAYVQTIWTNYKFNGNRYKKPGSQIDWGDPEIIAWSRLLLGYTLLP